MINIVAPWARELKGPTEYLPRYYEIENPKPGQKYHIDIAEGFDWDRVWDAYVETTKACLSRAKAHGLKFSIEQHTHCLVPDAASFLRLWDQIRDDDLGYNLDAGWTLLQREYPPVAIHKVGRHLMNVHMRDIDGADAAVPGVRRGVMDIQAIVDGPQAGRLQRLRLHRAGPASRRPRHARNLPRVPADHAGSAYPSGGGTIEEKACRDAMDRVLDSLRAAMPVDAVFLRLHGAMYAEGIGPAETVLVGEVRSIVGPDVPIACTFDLHGNIPARLARYGDILVGLKTAPHTDGAQTAELAGRILLETLKGRVFPVSYVLPIPIILQGEKAMTTSEPFRSLVEEARKLEREGIAGHEEKILAATIFVGCAWTDSPDTGMSVMVTADGSRDAARAAAVYLARKVWDARRQFCLRLRDRRAGGRRRPRAGGQGIDRLPDRQRRQRHGQHAGRPAHRAASPCPAKSQELPRRRHK